MIPLAIGLIMLALAVLWARYIRRYLEWTSKVLAGRDTSDSILNDLQWFFGTAFFSIIGTYIVIRSLVGW